MAAALGSGLVACGGGTNDTPPVQAEVEGLWDITFTVPESSDPEVLTVRFATEDGELTARLCSVSRTREGGEWVVDDISCNAERHSASYDAPTLSFTLGTGAEATRFNGEVTASAEEMSGSFHWPDCDCEVDFTGKRLEVEEP